MKYFKMLVIAIICFFSININAKPWNNNTREHLFGSVNECSDYDCQKQNHVDIDGKRYHVQASIKDVGFRWRNSFNFTINGKNILPQNWWFNGVVYVNDSEELEIYNDFVQNVIFHENGKYISISPNSIHAHLAKIADKVKEINKSASVTTAAVTIVVENGGNYYAFSEMINLQGKPYVATIKGMNPRNFIIAINDKASDIKTNINSMIDCNIPDRKYSCSEGKILSILTTNQLAIFKNTISDLLGQAQQKCNNNNLNYGSIRLVVLHIGTTMDPCAICTRCLVGISEHINENIDSYLRSTIQGSPGGSMNNAKFLMEVSSNGHYPTSTNSQDNFAAFGCGNCSHTECAGHDGGEANPINVSLNFSLIAGLAIPYGVPSNWVLSTSFPPYVVFGRTDDSYNVVNAPIYNQTDGTCNKRANNMHLRHDCTNILPLIR